MKEKIYYWLPRIFGCHCRDDRSFYYRGKKFPLCARCTGELFGILFSLILFWFWKPSIILSLIMMLPLVADGFLQQLTKYESTNLKRVITGFVFGIALSGFIAQTTLMAFSYGVNMGRNL